MMRIQEDDIHKILIIGHDTLHSLNIHSKKCSTVNQRLEPSHNYKSERNREWKQER